MEGERERELSDSLVAAYCDTSSPVVPFAVSVSPIHRCPSFPSLVTGLIRVSLLLRISTATLTCVRSPLLVFLPASCRAFSSYSISSRSRCLSNFIILHRSFLEQAIQIVCFGTGYMVEAI